MAEYIKRSALIAEFKRLGLGANSLVERIFADAVYVVIEKFPAADVTPVRHGKWMPFHAEFAGDIQYCSVCEIGFSDRTAYCPHCGAVMDGWRKEAAENDG